MPTDTSDAADAKRMRWLLEGNVAIFEKMPRMWHTCDGDDKATSRREIDEAMAFDTQIAQPEDCVGSPASKHIAPSAQVQDLIARVREVDEAAAEYLCALVADESSVTYDTNRLDELFNWFAAPQGEDYWYKISRYKLGEWS